MDEMSTQIAPLFSRIDFNIAWFVTKSTSAEAYNSNDSSGAGTMFGQGGGGKTGNAKLMRSLSNLDRVFVPEISVLQGAQNISRRVPALMDNSIYT